MTPVAAKAVVSRNFLRLLYPGLRHAGTPPPMRRRSGESVGEDVAIGRGETAPKNHFWRAYFYTKPNLTEGKARKHCSAMVSAPAIYSKKSSRSGRQPCEPAIRLLSLLFCHMLHEDRQLFFNHWQKEIKAHHVGNDHGKNHGV